MGGINHSKMGGLWHCYTHITGYSGDSCTPRWLLRWLLFISSSTQPGHVLGGERQGGPMCHHGPFNYHLHLQSELRLLWEKLVGWMCASLIAFVRFVGLSNNIHSHCICKVSLQDLVKMSDWWFGTCFMFPYIGNVIFPIDELIFFRGFETTNQLSVHSH